MMEAVHQYKGTINQVMGDGIMALFGAPLAHEDHAVRACYAALRMQERVKTYAEEARRAHAAVVNIRVGLNSGEVVVRAIGSDLHMDYTAVGQTTHLASRMEQIASPGTVVIAPDTLALVEGYVAVKSLGPVPVKGLADAVEVYEVTRAGPARTRLQAGARRGLTRFVGRDAEVEQLRRAQQLASAGHGQIAAIVGEAGVGKSRLVYEFTHSHRLQGWLILEAASVSYGKATSYWPVIDLLKGYFKNPQATAETIRDGWLYSGDHARMDEDGYFFFVDRKKDMIKRAGENVSASEVEETPRQHPTVFDAAIVGVPDPVRDQTIKAYVILRPGLAATAGELIEWCHARLSSFKVPELIEFRDTFPRT